MNRMRILLESLRDRVDSVENATSEVQFDAGDFVHKHDLVFPHDPDTTEKEEFDKMCEQLSSDVTTYYMEIEK